MTMHPTLRPLIAALAMMPALLSCSDGAVVEDPAQLRAAMAYIGESPGVARSKLHAAIDPLFGDGPEGGARAVIVMRQGRIVAERYAPGYHENTRFVSWSMAKTVTAVLIGMLVAEGRLNLDDPAPVPGWRQTGDPRGEITVRHLLQMRSGLKHAEVSEDLTQADTPRMLFLDGHDDVAAYAEAQPLAAEPGSQFAYSTATSMILADIATRIIAPDAKPEDRQAAMNAYLRDRLALPIDMQSIHAEYDANGTILGGSLIHASARDWARFGEFLRRGGAVDGAQLVPRSWIEFMRTPSPRDGSYGAHLWLNKTRPKDRPVNLFPAQGPANLFAALGHLGQYVIVSPDQQLVVVRLGHTDNAKLDPVRDQLARLIGLY